MRQDTYRNKPEARAFEAVRGEIVRRVLDVLGKRQWTATHIRDDTSIDVTASNLWKLREGDTSMILDNRLLVLGKALGLRFQLTVH